MVMFQYKLARERERERERESKRWYAPHAADASSSRASAWLKRNIEMIRSFERLPFYFFFLSFLSLFSLNVPATRWLGCAACFSDAFCSDPCPHVCFQQERRRRSEGCGLFVRFLSFFFLSFFLFLPCFGSKPVASQFEHAGRGVVSLTGKLTHVFLGRCTQRQILHFHLVIQGFRKKEDEKEKRTKKKEKERRKKERKGKKKKERKKDRRRPDNRAQRDEQATAKQPPLFICLMSSFSSSVLLLSANREGDFGFGNRGRVAAGEIKPGLKVHNLILARRGPFLELPCRKFNERNN